MMDLRLTRDQIQLVESFASLYDRKAATSLARSAEPDGFDRALWEDLLRMGAVTMALPDTVGGGASMLDLALVAQEHGRYIAPAPLLEAQVGIRVAARVSETGRPEPAAIVAGDRLATIALHEPVGAVAELVPAAAVADDVFVLRGSDLVHLTLDGHRRSVSTGSATPVADVHGIDGATVVATGAEAIALWQLAIDEWMVLTAAALVGLARRSLDVAVAYAKQRCAFDRVIGSFQAVAHPLADVATALDGAELLAKEAAWAAEADPERFSELSAMAFAFATESARGATALAVHVHGGYGVSLEYDAQMYFRRAQGWPALLAEPRVVHRWAYQRRMARRGA